MFMFIMLLSSLLSVGVSKLMTSLFFKDVGFLRALFMNMTLRQIFTVIFFFGITALVSAIVAKKSANPLEQLYEATQEVANGNYDVQVTEHDRSDEIGLLEHNFNVMTQELRGTVYLRKDFINSVSHEFKTPLASIAAYAKLLHNSDLPRDEQLDYASVIIEESGRLTNLITNILKLSKLDNQAIPEKAHEFSLDEQIRHTIMLLETAWSSKKIDLIIDLDEVRIKSDEEILQQVWVNLLDNAIKFTGDEGRIWVRLTQQDDRIKVEITDSGIGMDEHTLNRIFDQFYQGDSSRANAGNGLGLTLVKKIVEICSGRILVTSEPGKGSTFTVELPRNAGQRS